MDCARQILRDGPHIVQGRIINMVFKNNFLQPILKEAGEGLGVWLKAEKDPKALRPMVMMAAGYNVVQAIPALEELDRREPTPLPRELFFALTGLERKNFQPRLIEHLLHNKEAETRRAAAEELGTWGDQQCYDALITALADPAVNYSACVAISRCWRADLATPAQYEKAMGILINLVENGSKYEREGGEMALLRVNLLVGRPGSDGLYEPDPKKAAAAWRAYWESHRKKE